MSADTRQLQFFNPKTRRYEPSAHQGTEVLINPHMGAAGRPWRVARSERPLKPEYVVPRYKGYSHDIGSVQLEYLKWAQSRGLKLVTAFKDKPLNNGKAGKPIFTGNINCVDADNYFHVEEIVL